MKENKELNRELTEWADVEEYYTDEDGCQQRKVIQFTQSLDACFKHLVPKVLIKIPKIYGQIRAEEAFKLLLRFWADRRTQMDEPDIDALALCLVIEQLIDSKVVKEPWQMAKAEYVKQSLGKDKAYQNALKMTDKSNLPIEEKRAIDSASRKHEASVTIALSEGKPVPCDIENAIMSGEYKRGDRYRVV